MSFVEKYAKADKVIAADAAAEMLTILDDPEIKYALGDGPSPLRGLLKGLANESITLGSKDLHELVEKANQSLRYHVRQYFGVNNFGTPEYIERLKECSSVKETFMGAEAAESGRVPFVKINGYDGSTLQTDEKSIEALKGKVLALETVTEKLFSTGASVEKNPLEGRKQQVGRTGA